MNYGFPNSFNNSFVKQETDSTFETKTTTNETQNEGTCPNACPTYNCCNQVVNKCFYCDVPHYINYNTHTINNCIKRHYNVPTYSNTYETVYLDTYMNNGFENNNLSGTAFQGPLSFI